AFSPPGSRLTTRGSSPRARPWTARLTSMVSTPPTPRPVITCMTRMGGSALIATFRFRCRPGTRARSRSAQGLLQVGVDRVEEVLGVEPGLVRPDQGGQVLCHLAGLHGLDAHLLQRLGEAGDLRCPVEGAA